MDVQLQELIDKIKKDGVASAEESARNIISDAEKKAADIISNAKAEAEEIKKAAEKETERMKKAGEDAIAQASRNGILEFRNSVVKELSAIVEDEVGKTYSSDLLAKLLPETIKAWVANTDANDVSVLLPEASLKELESGLKAALKDEIANGLELKSDNNLSSGFRIGMKDGSAFYDFSADFVAELFSAYLNPRVTAIMKAAVAADKKGNN